MIRTAVVMAMICWMLWKIRNDIVWQGKRNNARFLFNTACRLLHEWQAARSFNEFSDSPTHHSAGVVIWTEPPLGKVIVNTDAAMFKDQRKIGIGCIVRNHLKQMLDGFSMAMDGDYSVREPEIEALCWLKTKHWSHVIMEMDALQVSPDHSVFGILIEDCKHLASFFTDLQFSFARRTANSSTHNPARVAGCVAGAKDRDHVPSFLSDVLISDSI